MEPLVVPGTMDSLSRIGEYVREATLTAGLDKKRSYRLRLAVDEIATNVVEHGYEGADLQGELSVWADFKPDRLVVTLEDKAAAFDPRGIDTHESASVSLSPEERPIGHLGIMLALQGIDLFDYQSTTDSNRSTFVMYLEPNHPESHPDAAPRV